MNDKPLLFPMLRVIMIMIRKTQHWSDHHVPGIVMYSLHALSHLICTTALWDVYH